MAVDSDIQRRKNAPDARADTILLILSSVFTSIELACLANGKAFTNPANPQRAKDSLYRPLISIQEIFLCLKDDLDRWAKPAKFLDYKSGSLSKNAVAVYAVESHSIWARLSRSENIPDYQKMQKLYKTLDRIGRIDENYVSVFTRFAEDLGSIRQEFRKLVNLLKEIVQDGNSLDYSKISPGTPQSLRDITNGQPHPRHRRRSSATCRNEEDPTELLSQHLTQTALLTPPSEPDPAPHWKHALSDWHPIEDLYVGRAEILVFGEALHQAKKCAIVAKATQELASGLAEMAEEQHVIWEQWWEVWQGWNNEEKRREREDEEEY